MGQALFVVSVDTEADDAWRFPDRINLANLRDLPRFQALCNRYGVIPTYLVTYECAARDEALQVLMPLFECGRCEIGHHLHCWTTPPFSQVSAAGVDMDWLGAYQSELPANLLLEKAECLRDKIEQSFGRSPTSHRAGRWGIDQRSVDWLIASGFIAETSVVPLTSWAQARGRRHYGPSFYNSPVDPYRWYSTESGRQEHSLVEVPVSVAQPSSVMGAVCRGYIRRSLPGAQRAVRFYRRLGGGRALRPNPNYPPHALSGIVSDTLERGAPIVNLMLHSSELTLDCSPFTRTRKGLESVWARLEEVFCLVKRLGCKPVGLTDAAQLWSQQEGRGAYTNTDAKECG